MFGISKGMFLTLKSTFLGLGFHKMIGQKLPIIILSHLGQSITYHTLHEIETAQAEVSEYYLKSGMKLLIQPKNPESPTSTIFWWDNFDRFVDTGARVGSIHNTPGIACQDETSDRVKRKDLSINRSK